MRRWSSLVVFLLHVVAGAVGYATGTTAQIRTATRTWMRKDERWMHQQEADAFAEMMKDMNQIRPKKARAATPTTGTKKPSAVLAPNADWRQALLNPYRPGQAPPSQKLLKNKNASERVLSDSLDGVELTYEVLMEVLEEEELGGGVGNHGKYYMPEERAVEGLKSGMVIDKALWTFLHNADGQPLSLDRVASPLHKLLILYADPRPLTSSFKTALQQFALLPTEAWKASLLAINCDDASDLRKFQKKTGSASRPSALRLAVDPTMKFMESFRCHVPDEHELRACLAIVETGSGCLVNVWYEDDWDLIVTKDLLREHMQAYRSDPKGYVLRNS